MTELFAGPSYFNGCIKQDYKNKYLSLETGASLYPHFLATERYTVHSSVSKMHAVMTNGLDPHETADLRTV